MFKQYSNLQFTVLKQLILDYIYNLKGQDIVCFDMDKNSITNIMILCTGQSNRHVVSIAQNILHKFQNMDLLKFYGIEGIESGEWVLVDLGDIIIHIMKKETRELFSLEKLWC